MKKVESKNAPAAIGPYSHGYVVNNILYASGQIPVDPKTGEIPATIEAQADLACKNVGYILNEAGTSFEKVFKTTCYLNNMDDFAKFNEVYAKYFTSYPARSCVAVKALPKNVLCEIEVLAEI